MSRESRFPPGAALLKAVNRAVEFADELTPVLGDLFKTLGLSHVDRKVVLNFPVEVSCFDIGRVARVFDALVSSVVDNDFRDIS